MFDAKTPVCNANPTESHKKCRMDSTFESKNAIKTKQTSWTPVTAAIARSEDTQATAAVGPLQRRQSDKKSAYIEPKIKHVLRVHKRRLKEKQANVVIKATKE